VALALRISALSAALLVLFGSSAAAQRADLAEARTLYNKRQFDGAIEAAKAAQKIPDTADAATVVLARAHLERYRERANPDDLSAARIALGTVRVSALDSRDLGLACPDLLAKRELRHLSTAPQMKQVA